jgi:hypothetical protein
MKTFFLVCIITFSSKIYGQVKNDSIFFSGQNYMIYKTALTGVKIKSENLISLLAPFERGIFFFYPDVDSTKRVNYNNQIKELASSTEFKNAKVIGIPFIEAKTDDANVWLDTYIITGIQCFIYTKNDKDLIRALKMNSEIISDQKNLPQFFSRIDVNKEEVCVKDNRIIFFEKIINEFLSPQLTKDEKIDLLIVNQNLIFEKISSQNAQIEKLKSEISDLRKELEKQSSSGKM